MTRRPANWPAIGRHRLPVLRQPHRGRRRLAVVGVAATALTVALQVAVSELPMPTAGPTTAQAAEIGAAATPSTPVPPPERPVERLKDLLRGQSTPETPQAATGAHTPAVTEATTVAATPATTTAATPAYTPPPKPSPSRAPWPPNCGATT